MSCDRNNGRVLSGSPHLQYWLAITCLFYPLSWYALTQSYTHLLQHTLQNIGKQQPRNDLEVVRRVFSSPEYEQSAAPLRRKARYPHSVYSIERAGHSFGIHHSVTPAASQAGRVRSGQCEALRSAFGIPDRRDLLPLD